MLRVEIPQAASRMGLVLLLVVVFGVAIGAARDDSDGEPVPALSAASDKDDEAASVKLDGHLAQLGPVVVHEDGTMGRLKDWGKMTAHEQAAILATVQKRNAARRARLQEREQQEREQQDL